jgi:hypothetical protein
MKINVGALSLWIHRGSDFGVFLVLHSFHHAFSLTETGLHRPKIVICFGSSGGSFKQLVKGEDDIRQDCIMVRAYTLHLVSALFTEQFNISSISLFRHSNKCFLQ